MIKKILPLRVRMTRRFSQNCVGNDAYIVPQKRCDVGIAPYRNAEILHSSCRGGYYVPPVEFAEQTKRRKYIKGFHLYNFEALPSLPLQGRGTACGGRVVLKCEALLRHLNSTVG